MWSPAPSPRSVCLPRAGVRLSVSIWRFTSRLWLVGVRETAAAESGATRRRPPTTAPDRTRPGSISSRDLDPTDPARLGPIGPIGRHATHRLWVWAGARWTGFSPIVCAATVDLPEDILKSLCSPLDTSVMPVA